MERAKDMQGSEREGGSGEGKGSKGGRASKRARECTERRGD